jgi:hypothetical protein
MITWSRNPHVRKINPKKSKIQVHRNMTQRLLELKHQHYWNKLTPNKYQFMNENYKKERNKINYTMIIFNCSLFKQ